MAKANTTTDELLTECLHLCKDQQKTIDQCHKILDSMKEQLEEDDDE